MSKRTKAADRRGLLLSLFVLGLAIALIVLPATFGSKAGAKGNWRTESAEPGFENYDIRQDKNDEVNQYLTAARESLGATPALIQNNRKEFTKGEDNLRRSIPTLKVEYNEDIRTPEVIAPDISKGFKTMTGPASKGVKNADTLRSFIQQNNSLIGVSDFQASQLKVTADYINPAGNIAYAHLEQFINDVPVFRAEIKAGFTHNGEMFRVINNLAPNLTYEALSSDFGNPTDAVKAAFTKVSRQMTTEDTNLNSSASNDLKVVFGSGDWATTAEKMYFPTEPGVAVPAWRVMIWQPVNAYYVIVDAKTGTMLWRKNLGNDQTQSATYQVYQTPSSWLGPAVSPAPLQPGPIDPTAGVQGTITTRTNLTVIGNEAPNHGLNNLGWITDATNITDGNNVQAGIDRDGSNGVDAPQTGSPNRVFDSTWNPPPGAPTPGDAPVATQPQRGAVIQMFYIMNRYHDELYNLGFTEPARNFQNDNFGRGGVANDRVSAEGQDSSGTDNANFNAGADGTRGRMQMYIFTGPSPQRDGTTDAEVIIHEVTHGTSQRLHNNNAGLTANMSGGMGEGWGDFYAHSMLAKASDPLDSTNAEGGWVMLNGFGVVGTQNYYYGIRRFPKARMSFTGGPNNRPHNPMTFADIDSNQINVTNGAYPAMAGPHISTTADQVHAAGEIWSSALWEVRCQMVGRLGFAAGTQKVLQAVTDGMKLDPVNPTFLQSRDSIIAAASAFPIAPEAGADAADVREGFRIRGMGFSASIQSGNGSPARVTEAFDVANVTIIDPFSVSDTPGDNDGFPEPGENVLLNVSVTNTTGNTLNGVVANVTGGGSANYGSITNGQTKTMAIAYTVPANVPCGSLHTVTLNVNSTEVPAFNTVTRSFRVGTPVGGAPVTFNNNTATVINDGATGAPAASTPYGTTINVSGLTGNKTMKLGITNFTHTFPGDVDMLLVGPAGQKMIPYSDVVGGTDAVNISFKMVDTATDLLPAAAALVNGAEYKPSDVTSGDTFPAPAPAAPYLSAAPVGSSTFNSVYGTSGAALNGTWTLYMVDDAGQDTGTTGGWSLTFEANDFDCNIGPQTGNSDARADFDGDGKSDLSVFRPGTGIWYMNRSQAGFAAVNWGIAGDTPVPGDYDGDDKTDPAIYRPSNTAGVPDFYVLKSSTGTVTGAEFGLVGDVPVVGDYNGDDIDDYSVYRASTGIWYTMTNTGAVTLTNVGTTGTPVSGDFNGDDISDIAMFNAGTWTIRLSGGATITPTWGQAGDKLVPADYDGDGKDDLAVFRNGQWLIHGSAGVDSTVNWGVAGDIPVPGNYDGDTKEDVAIYRNGTWYVNGSTSGIQITAFGLGSDTAIESKYQQ